MPTTNPEGLPLSATIEWIFEEGVQDQGPGVGAVKANVGPWAWDSGENLTGNYDLLVGEDVNEMRKSLVKREVFIADADGLFTSLADPEFMYGGGFSTRCEPRWEDQESMLTLSPESWRLWIYYEVHNKARVEAAWQKMGLDLTTVEQVNVPEMPADMEEAALQYRHGAGRLSFAIVRDGVESELKNGGQDVDEAMRAMRKRSRRTRRILAKAKAAEQ
mmetsp:Transcript_125613/g.268062  ORF Transcript_125613/g.268062 Transcript_125613/m.268062 type:complete len:218 (-) Transcript_125613:97-750(-)